ncbi:hypothetical protein Anapl_04958 [Anas platyrhynchos]|uniref:Uncharacterized protein n=1 Tax=Anas platyrhynchos TaxID=8839 RepID=R0KVY6_ANAPL|nr:hypothetical protein Anapl_04958 [Anas platyrhynchos]
MQTAERFLQDCPGAEGFGALPSGWPGLRSACDLHDASQHGASTACFGVVLCSEQDSPVPWLQRGGFESCHPTSPSVQLPGPPCSETCASGGHSGCQSIASGPGVVRPWASPGSALGPGPCQVWRTRVQSPHGPGHPQPCGALLDPAPAPSALGWLRAPSRVHGAWQQSGGCSRQRSAAAPANPAPRIGLDGCWHGSQCSALVLEPSRAHGAVRYSAGAVGDASSSSPEPGCCLPALRPCPLPVPPGQQQPSSREQWGAAGSSGVASALPAATLPRASQQCSRVSPNPVGSHLGHAGCELQAARPAPGWGRRDGARQRRDARARCQRCAEHVPTPGQGCSSPSVGTNAAPQGSPVTPAHSQPLPAVSQGLGTVDGEDTARLGTPV